MDSQDTTTVQTQEKVKGGKIGISIADPTPMWATWVFRIQFCANKAILFWLAGTHTVSLGSMQEAILVLGAVDMFVWGIGRAIGVKKPDDNTNN